ncbi:MAG: type II secretion system F family protein [Lachnospiraceae bacterium]|nr:type II secretion system F family protein [Lachnospiraceae bacterium]
MVYAALSEAAAWLFYDSLPAGLAAAPLFILFIKAAGRIKAGKYRDDLTEGFLKSLNSVSSSLAAGLSADRAFVLAESDMEKLFGKRSAIVKELEIINTQTAMGKRIEDALSDFAKRTEISEIYDFAVVFSVAMKNGADLSKVIASCTGMMEDRRQAENEARVLIRAKQYEQRLMCVIPPGILIYLRLSSGSFISVLYHDPRGIAVMTAALAVYVAAVILSEKIGDIRV